jgi:Oxidoreductase-like protein, N-terminal
MSTTVKPAKPNPPRKPEPYECCGTGCIPCVMDIYEEELWQYEKDLKAWQANNADTQAKEA